MNKALLVGINKYPNCPLQGCVNDVLLFYKVLSEKFNFETKNIDVITDYDCTKLQIINRLSNLVKNVEPGDQILFQFSGHGSQVVVNDKTNNDEADGRDEILCPIDLNWKDPLRDHELGNIFKVVPKGVKITVILDCCHSGTGLRNNPHPMSNSTLTSRFMPPPISNILFNPSVSIDDDLNFIFAQRDVTDIQTIKNNFLVNTLDQGDIMLITGCQDNQTSADAFIAGKYRGALSYHLCQALAESNYNVTYEDLVTTVNAKLDLSNYQQNPQLEGNQELFKRLFLR